MIYNKAWAETSELTSGKIEYQAVRMLKPAHIRLDEFTKRDFHIDTVGAFSNFYTCDLRMRIAQPGTGVLLRERGGRSESDQQEHERYCWMDTHRCGGLRLL